MSTWVYKNVPSAMVGLAGAGTMSNLMAGMDPQLMAQAVNDDDMRADIIELWQESLPEMEPDAAADVVNQLLADPNTAALIVDVIAGLDEEAVGGLCNSIVSDPTMADHVVALLPNLEAEGLSNLANALASSNSTATLVRALVEHTDANAVGRLVNDILLELDDGGEPIVMVDEFGNMTLDEHGNPVYECDSAVIDATVDLMTEIDTDALTNMINRILEDGRDDLGEFVNTLVASIEGEGIAALVDGIVSYETEEQGLVALQKTNELLQVLATDDATTPGIDESKIFRNFLFQVLGDDGTIDFLNGMLGSLNPDNKPEALQVLDDLFLWGQGLHETLYGELSVNDALLDHLWVQAKVEKVYTDGLAVTEYAERELWAMFYATVRNQLIERLGFSEDYAEQVAEDFADWLVEPDTEDPSLAKGIAGLIDAVLNDFFVGISYYVRISDLGFGVTPVWSEDGYPRPDNSSANIPAEWKDSRPEEWQYHLLPRDERF
jgi:hypothetical protein